MGENHFAPAPTAVVRRGAADGRRSRTRSCSGRSSPSTGRTRCCATALGRDLKGKLSPVLYAAAIPLAFVNRWIAVGALRPGGADVAGPRPAHRVALRGRGRGRPGRRLSGSRGGCAQTWTKGGAGAGGSLGQAPVGKDHDEARAVRLRVLDPGRSLVQAVNRSTIDRPMPTPGECSSTPGPCRNGSKICAFSSSEMPAPRSSTSMRAPVGARRSRTMTADPAGV